MKLYECAGWTVFEQTEYARGRGRQSILTLQFFIYCPRASPAKQNFPEKCLEDLILYNFFMILCRCITQRGLGQKLPKGLRFTFVCRLVKLQAINQMEEVSSIGLQYRLTK